MEKTEQNISELKIPLTHKVIGLIHSAEANFSELVYKSWCGLKGGKFERRNPSRSNACLLVTKRSSHIFASSIIFLYRILFPFRIIISEFKNFFSRKYTKQPTLLITHLSNLELEVYELNCPESASFGQGQKEQSFAFKKKENCVMCGRCFEVRESDKKIVGDFYES